MSCIDCQEWVDTWDPDFVAYFNEWDLDQDGVLSLDEVEHWKGATGQNFDTTNWMEHHDWMGDGVIDEDEFNYAWNSMNGGFGFYDPNYYHWIGTHRDDWSVLDFHVDMNNDGYDATELALLIGDEWDIDEVLDYYSWMEPNEAGNLDEWAANSLWNESRAGWNFFDPVIQEFMDKFEMADADNNGQISAGEMIGLFGPDADGEAIMNYYNWDETADSLSEYEAQWAYYDYVHGYGIWCPVFQDFANRFAEADSDGDNFLNRNELYTFFGADADVEGMIAYYDYNNTNEGLDYWMVSWAHQELTYGYGFFDPEPWIDHSDPEFMEVWHSADADQDGFVTVNEIYEALGDDLVGIDVYDMVSLYDWDDSTHLCMDEALFAYNDYVYGRGVFEGIHTGDDDDDDYNYWEHMEENFHDVDLNDDGLLSAEEIMEAAGDEYDTDAMLQHYDFDQSGHLDMMEFDILWMDAHEGWGFFEDLDGCALCEIEENAWEIIESVWELQEMGYCEDCEDCEDCDDGDCYDCYDYDCCY